MGTSVSPCLEGRDRAEMTLHPLQYTCTTDAVVAKAGSHDVFADFQGTSNGGRQFLRIRRSNRHIVPLYGKSDSRSTQGLKFETR